MVRNRVISLFQIIQSKLSTRTNSFNFLVVTALCLTIALPRILPFPRTFLTYDEMRIGVWVSEMARALVEGDWGKTAITNNPYPAVSLAWIETVQAEVAQLFPSLAPGRSEMLSDTNEQVFASLPRRRLTLALINTLIIFAIFELVRRLYDNFVAVTATILMALDPFLLVESRIFRVEGLTTGLMMLSALMVILYTKDRQKGWLITSGILAGLAALTRVSALFTFPFAGLVLLAGPLLTGKCRIIPLLRRMVGDVLLWLLVMGFVFIALWPALWVSPLEGPGKIYDVLKPFFTDTGRVWEKGVFFQGHTMGDIDPGPIFYLYALAYRTTPIVWLGLGAFFMGGMALLAQILRARLVRKSQEIKIPAQPISKHLPGVLSGQVIVSRYGFTLLILAYVFFYFVSINLSATKIDRYLVAMLPALSILAALGFEFIIICIFSSSKRVIILMKRVIWGGVLIGSALFSLPHHPYYYTYWNPILGGGKTAVNILPATGRQGIDVMLDYLNTLPDADKIKLAGPGLHLDFIQECPVVFVGRCLDYAEFLSSDYFLLSNYEVQNEVALANLPMIIPDVKIERKYTKDGVDYAWLYKMPAGLQFVGYWLDLFSGSFLGYRFSKTEAGTDDSVIVTLFWRNGEKSGWRFHDSELFVKVLNETGQIQQIVPAQLKPEFLHYLAQPGETLVFTAPLYFPADTPLGVYTTEIGLRLKSTHKETLNFPLSASANRITVNRGITAVLAKALLIQHRLEQPVGVTGLTLVGYDSPVPPLSGEARGIPNFYLYWRVDKSLTQDYDLKLTLLDDNNQAAVSWSNSLAPQIYPLTTWQPGEVVKLAFPLELGYTLPLASYQPVLSIFPANHPETEPLAIISLSPLLTNSVLTPLDINMQHKLEHTTFGESLDLLGYDLIGKGNASTGTLLVTLYWLNRQPLEPVEAEVRVLDEKGQIVAQQLLPIPPSASSYTWRGVSHYELRLNTLPSSLTIRARPGDIEKWYNIQKPGASATEAVIINDILNKTTVVIK